MLIEWDGPPFGGVTLSHVYHDYVRCVLSHGGRSVEALVPWISAAQALVEGVEKDALFEDEGVYLAEIRHHGDVCRVRRLPEGPAFDVATDRLRAAAVETLRRLVVHPGVDARVLRDATYGAWSRLAFATIARSDRPRP